MAPLCWTVVLLALAAPPSPVLAETGGSSDAGRAIAADESSQPSMKAVTGRKRSRRFWIKTSLVSIGGKAGFDDLERGMRAASLDQPFPPLDADAASWLAPIMEVFGLWGYTYGYTPPSFPESSASRDTSRTFAIGYALRPALDLEVVIDGKAQRLGSTSGNHADPAAYLTISKAIRTYAAVASYGAAGGRVRLGLGPSLNALRVEDGWPARRRSRLQPGLVGEGRLVFPRRSLLMFDLTVQYRYVLAAKFAAVPVMGDGGEQVTTFPSTRMSFSRWTVSFGAGVRM